MITKTELQSTLTVGGIVFLLAGAYALRLAVKGRAHFERLDRQGGSRLLSKRVMEFSYWGLDPMARLLVRLEVRPNQITWASLVLGFCAGACLALGHFGFGAIFATVSALLDSLDGMVARLSSVASESGEILDAAVDRYVEYFFLAGLVFYYREFALGQALALFALLGSFMVSYSSAKAEALSVEPPRGSMRRPERAVYLISGAALSALTVPFLENSARFAPPLAYPMIAALALVAIVANFSAILRLRAIAIGLRLRRQPQQDAPQAGTPPHLPLWISLRRSQISSLIATVVDFSSLIFFVEIVHVWYVAATAMGAFLGALVNFILGRHWSFSADGEPVHGQAMRYTLVATGSLILNSGAVYILTDSFGLHYAVSKAITAVLVGLFFNFPLHRGFVFARRKPTR